MEAVHRVICFDSVGFENMLNPIYNGQGIDMFCAGNSNHPKQIAEHPH